MYCRKVNFAKRITGPNWRTFKNLHLIAFLSCKYDAKSVTNLNKS